MRQIWEMSYTTRNFSPVHVVLNVVVCRLDYLLLSNKKFLFLGFFSQQNIFQQNYFLFMYLFVYSQFVCIRVNSIDIIFVYFPYFWWENHIKAEGTKNTNISINIYKRKPIGKAEKQFFFSHFFLLTVLLDFSCTV